MKTRNWHKFPILFSLYIAQSIPMSFFSTVVPVIMRQEKFSLEAIGLLQLIKLPWILKFLWAPMVDNHTRSTRSIKSWIVVSELFYAIVILSIAMFNLQTDFKLIVGLIIVAFIASGTQDIATDIYAILSLKKSERGLGNSMQSAGSFIGALMGTGVLLVAYHYFGWTNVLLLLALFVVIAIIPLIFSKQKLAIDSEVKQRVKFNDILLFFKNKNALKQILILIFFYSGIIGTLTMLKPYLVDLGYGVKDIAFMSGIYGTSVAAASALLGGFLMKKIPRKSAAFLFVIAGFLSALFWIYVTLNPIQFGLYFAIGFVWGAYGLSTVAVYTIAMDFVRPGREGTDFTIQIVLTHLSSLIISVLSGKIAHTFNYNGLFIGEAILAAITFFIIWIVMPKKHNDTNKITHNTQ